MPELFWARNGFAGTIVGLWGGYAGTFGGSRGGMPELLWAQGGVC